MGNAYPGGLSYKRNGGFRGSNSWLRVFKPKINMILTCYQAFFFCAEKNEREREKKMPDTII